MSFHDTVHDNARDIEQFRADAREAKAVTVTYVDERTRTITIERSDEAAFTCNLEMAVSIIAGSGLAMAATAEAQIGSMVEGELIYSKRHVGTATHHPPSK